MTEQPYRREGRYGQHHSASHPLENAIQIQINLVFGLRRGDPLQQVFVRDE